MAAATTTRTEVHQTQQQLYPNQGYGAPYDDRRSSVSHIDPQQMPAAEHGQMKQLNEVSMQQAATGVYDPIALANAQPGVCIFLTPYAAPSALGFAGFFSSMWLLSTWLCGWYGSDTTTPAFNWALWLTFGGLGQFLAGMWCFPARDKLGSVYHTMWGAFFIALGLVYGFGGNVLVGFDRFAANPNLAMWLVTLGAVSIVCAIAAAGRDLGFFCNALLTAVGCVLAFGGWFSSDVSGPRSLRASGYFFMVASLFALLRCAVYLIEESFLQNYVPTALHPMSLRQAAVRIPIGEPGVRKGQ